MLAKGPSWDHSLSSATSDANAESGSFFEGATLESVRNAFPEVMDTGWKLQVVIASTFAGGMLVRQLPARKDNK